ncbi:hypothetical protein M3Y96_00197600 [Aphelenchoides besseyi]|nr:hypothetical protein M3Y96_00197600 [Aphelenchoides besseyi]
MHRKEPVSNLAKRRMSRVDGDCLTRLEVPKWKPKKKSKHKKDSLNGAQGEPVESRSVERNGRCSKSSGKNGAKSASPASRLARRRATTTTILTIDVPPSRQHDSRLAVSQRSQRPQTNSMSRSPKRKTAKKKRKRNVAPESSPKIEQSEYSGENNDETAESAGTSTRDSTRRLKNGGAADNVRSFHSEDSMGRQRVPSVTKAAAVAQIAPDAPIILFMGGPGGGKTKYAARIRDALEDRGLVHICVPDLIKDAISRYKDRFPEWREASRRYDRGELIPNELAQHLVKAEMGRYPQARAYFLEGFPREARQVEDFERNVRSVNMAMILDYDEDTLRKHMTARGLSAEVVDRRISEFRMKTLPSAKYFDDHRLLHLIPGEKDEETIIERMKKLTIRALESGVQVLSQTPTPSQQQTPSAIQSPTNEGTEPKTDAGNVVEATAPTNGTLKSAQSTPPLTPSNIQNSHQPTNSAVPTSQPTADKPRSISRQSSHAQRPETDDQSVVLTNGKNTPTSTGRDDQNSPSESRRGGSRSSKSEVSSSPITQQPRNFQSRPSTTGQSISAMHNATNLPGSRAGSEKTLTRSNSQISAASRQSNVQTEEGKAIGSRQSSLSRTGSRDSAATKPPTAQGSRPATQTSKRSSAAEPVAVVRPEQPIAERPPSSVASTPKPTAAGFDVPSQLSSGRPGGTSSSRVPTADERFPKGLPNNAPVVLVIGRKTNHSEDSRLILGPAGSNKTEVAERLARKYDGFVHLSMGDLLRKKVQQNSGDELWSRVGKKMDNGEAIPMKICRDLLYSAIHEAGARSWGYVISGYPRSLAQAEDVEAQLGRLDVAVLLDCTEQFCRDNLRKRLEENREHGMNERLDDEENAAKQRLNLFKQNTLPMLKHLDDMGKLRVVEGDNGAEKLFQDVAHLLDESVFIKGQCSLLSFNTKPCR